MLLHDVMVTLTDLEWLGLLKSPFTIMLLVVATPAVFYHKGRLPFATNLGILFYIASFIIFNAFRFFPYENEAQVLLRKAIYTNAGLFMTMGYAFCVTLIIWWSRRGNPLHLIDQLVWIIIPFAEGVQWTEHTGCKIVLDPYFGREWESDEQTSCARALGHGAEYIAPAVTTILLVWILYKAWKSHRNPSHGK